MLLWSRIYVRCRPLRWGLFLLSMAYRVERREVRYAEETKIDYSHALYDAAFLFVNQHYQGEEKEVLGRALVRVRDIFEGRKRDSGVDYYLHCVDAFLRAHGVCVNGALSLVHDEAEYDRIIEHVSEANDVLVLDGGLGAAILLHDAYEDTTYGIEEIKNDFGEEVGCKVASYSKLKSYELAQIKQPEERAACVVKAQICSIAFDPGRLWGKICGDIWSNGVTIPDLAKDGSENAIAKQRRKAKEYLQRYGAFALELHIIELNGVLDMMFSIADPEAYAQMVRMYSNIASGYRNVVDSLEMMGISHGEREIRGDVPFAPVRGVNYRLSLPGYYAAYEELRRTRRQDTFSFRPRVFMECETERVRDEVLCWLRHKDLNFPQCHFPQTSNFGGEDADKTSLIMKHRSGVCVEFVIYLPEKRWMYVPFRKLVSNKRSDADERARKELMSRYGYYFSLFDHDMPSSLLLQVWNEQAGRELMRLFVQNGNQKEIYIPRESVSFDAVCSCYPVDKLLSEGRIQTPTTLVSRDGSGSICFSTNDILSNFQTVEFVEPNVLVVPSVELYQKLQTEKARRVLYLAAKQALGVVVGNKAELDAIVLDYEKRYLMLF